MPKKRCIACGTEINLKFFEEFDYSICPFCERDMAEIEYYDENSYLLTEFPEHDY